MTELEEMLRDDRCGVLRPPGLPSHDAIAGLAEQYGWLLRDVSLEGATGKLDYIHAWATALAFPDWHGHNWDAFEESLGDLSWLPESNGCIAVVSGRPSGAPEDIELGSRVVEESVTDRPADALPLIVVYQ